MAKVNVTECIVFCRICGNLKLFTTAPIIPQDIFQSVPVCKGSSCRDYKHLRT